MKLQSASYWITTLGLQPHPEGGFYREVFRSEKGVARLEEPGEKQAVTSIYYLLEGNDYSGFHRIKSDELWYFHKGEPLHIHVISHTGDHELLELSDNHSGQLSHVVKAGLWFAAEIPSKSNFCLVSCAVAPGFEFTEFEMADEKILIENYPQHAVLFNRLCR